MITADLATGTYTGAFFCPTAGKIIVGAIDNTTLADLVINGGGNTGLLGGGAATNEWHVIVTVTTATTDSVTGQIVCANAPVGTAAPTRAPATSRFVKTLIFRLLAGGSEKSEPPAPAVFLAER